MTSRSIAIAVVAFLGGVTSSVFFLGQFHTLVIDLPAAHAGDAAPKPNLDPRALHADIERLKTIVPDQSHVMKDVDYHFTNLWFAGKAKNWPLAEFYWKETLSHLHWAVRIIPVRKDNAGKDIKLEEILQAIEMTPTMQMGDVVKEKNAGKFEPTYRAILEGCHLCHKAADKPYLQTQVPERPATSIINFDPKAAGPK